MALCERLPPRLMELARAVHAGGTYAEVGRQMGLSAYSVKAYMQRIFDKLQIHGASPRQQLVLMLEREKQGAAK
jgi:DNA-binding NarL/FixJ family response regulator